MAEIVTLADRPDLIPPVAGWIFAEWGSGEATTPERVAAFLATHTSRSGPEQTFVLLDAGIPAASASLIHADLDARPDLTPWLASVYVAETFRRRGHATRLVQAVERACIAAAVPTVWLHTASATALYARLGWQAAGASVYVGRPVTLMRRDFA